MSDAVIVIMAGGAGERFWPLSNSTTPKQMLRLHGERTLLQAAFDRAARIVPAGNVYIVAGEKLCPAILTDLPELRPSNFISEPIARNTAACLGLAACHIATERGRTTTMGVLTADHIIDETDEFFSQVRAAIAHAAQGDDLVTLGITPVRAETGFGYLEIGDELARHRTDLREESVRRVVRFAEKPDAATAEQFVESGRYLWNSGMFFWRAEVLLHAFEAHQPAMFTAWKSLMDHGGPPFAHDHLEKLFRALPSVPVDKAIMEKSSNVAAIAGRFGWEDVGSWDALSRVLSTDAHGNCMIGPGVLMDSRNNVIYNAVGEGEEHPQELILQGVHDMIVVRTARAVLMTPKSDAQRVKEIVRKLAEADKHHLL